MSQVMERQRLGTCWAESRVSIWQNEAHDRVVGDWNSTSRSEVIKTFTSLVVWFGSLVYLYPTSPGYLNLISFCPNEDGDGDQLTFGSVCNHYFP